MNRTRQEHLRPTQQYNLCKPADFEQKPQRTGARPQSVGVADDCGSDAEVQPRRGFPRAMAQRQKPPETSKRDRAIASKHGNAQHNDDKMGQ